MTKKIAILLPYKENYNIDNAGAASIWVKDYLKYSNLKSETVVWQFKFKFKPLSKNFKNLKL